MFGIMSPYWWKKYSWSFILVEINGCLYSESYSHFDSRRSKVKSYKLFFPTDLNKYSFIPSPIRTKLDRWDHQFWMIFGVWPRKLTPVLSVQVMRIIPPRELCLGTPYHQSHKNRSANALNHKKRIGHVWKLRKAFHDC